MKIGNTNWKTATVCIYTTSYRLHYSSNEGGTPRSQSRAVSRSAPVDLSWSTQSPTKIGEIVLRSRCFSQSANYPKPKTFQSPTKIGEIVLRSHCFSQLSANYPKPIRSGHVSSKGRTSRKTFQSPTKIGEIVLRFSRVLSPLEASMSKQHRCGSLGNLPNLRQRRGD